MKMTKKSSSIPVFQVDAFTEEPFGGNPAAVCLVDAFLPEETMRKIAMEMNLSETAFVVPLGQGGKHGSFEIRWFTPTVEVPLCGHATLASSWVIFTEKETSASRITFQSASGTLAAIREGNGITLDFPRNDTEPATVSAGLVEALGLKAVEDVQASRSAEMLLLRVEDEAILSSLRPDVAAMLAANQGDPPFQGVIVTSRSSTFDFVSVISAPGRDRRGPGDRRGSYGPRSLLVGDNGEDPVSRFPGLEKGRRACRHHGRGTGDDLREGSHSS